MPLGASEPHQRFQPRLSTFQPLHFILYTPAIILYALRRAPGPDASHCENRSEARRGNSPGRRAPNRGSGRAGKGESSLRLRHRSAHLSMGPVVGATHSSAARVRSRVLWRGGKCGRRSHQRPHRRFRLRGNARRLRALLPVPHGPEPYLPERAHYRHRHGRLLCGVRHYPGVEHLEDRSGDSRGLCGRARSPGQRRARGPGGRGRRAERCDYGLRAHRPVRHCRHQSLWRRADLRQRAAPVPPETG